MKFTNLTKRQQFILVTLLLGIGMVLTQLVPVEWRYPMVGLLSLVTYFGARYALREDLKGIELLTLLTLPTLFTAAIASFYFLLPVRWLTRVPVVVLYMIGMYALLLTENIYNVAADRTIALLRAAHSVGFLLTLLSYFLLTQTILAFRFPFFFDAALVAIMSFLLAFQSLWAMELEGKPSRRVWRLSIVIAAVLTQFAWVFSFLPTKTTLQALLFTTVFYGLVGMAQQYLLEKLYKKTVIEFFSVCMIVLFMVIATTHWRGNL
jgi:hypothetical protein